MEMKELMLLNDNEKKELAKKMWTSEKMQKYLIDTYDFYKTKDNYIIELQKVNKITINKTMYYDDETEAPSINENNFITYNKKNIPNRNLENYIEEKKRLETTGCASGRYDYKGIYFISRNENIVYCSWNDEKNEYFKRYLTSEEQKEYIELMEERTGQYIERLKKYFKRYNKNITTYGYWANR